MTGTAIATATVIESPSTSPLPQRGRVSDPRRAISRTDWIWTRTKKRITRYAAAGRPAERSLAPRLHQKNQQPSARIGAERAAVTGVSASLFAVAGAAEPPNVTIAIVRDRSR